MHNLHKPNCTSRTGQICTQAPTYTQNTRREMEMSKKGDANIYMTRLFRLIPNVPNNVSYASRDSSEPV